VGKSALVSGLFLVLFLFSAGFGALGLAFRYATILHSCSELAVPFLSISACCVVAGALLVFISEKVL
jgi:hypothetical protein